MNLAKSKLLSTLVKLTLVTLKFDFPANVLKVASSHPAREDKRTSNGLETVILALEVKEEAYNPS